MVLCAYVDMLNLEDHMKGHRFFRQAAQIAVEVTNNNCIIVQKKIIFLFIRYIFVFMIIHFLIKIMTKMIILVLYSELCYEY
jgi:hypothetical protein